MDFEHPENTALAGIKAFRSFLGSIGLPLNFEQLGAKEEDIPKLVEMIGIGDGETGGFVHLKRADIENIYHLAAQYK